MSEKELILVRQADGKWAVEDPTPQGQPAHTLARGPGVFQASAGGIASMEIAGIPIGEAAVGGLAALVVTELADGFLANQTSIPKWLAKGLSAYVLANWGQKFLPGDAARIGAAFIAFDALRDLVPIDRTVAGFFKKGDGAVARETQVPIKTSPDGRNPALARLGVSNI